MERASTRTRHSVGLALASWPRRASALVWYVYLSCFPHLCVLPCLWLTAPPPLSLLLLPPAHQPPQLVFLSLSLSSSALCPAWARAVRSVLLPSLLLPGPGHVASQGTLEAGAGGAQRGAVLTRSVKSLVRGIRRKNRSRERGVQSDSTV